MVPKCRMIWQQCIISLNIFLNCSFKYLFTITGVEKVLQNSQHLTFLRHEKETEMQDFLFKKIYYQCSRQMKRRCKSVCTQVLMRKKNPMFERSANRCECGANPWYFFTPTFPPRIYVFCYKKPPSSRHDAYLCVTYRTTFCLKCTKYPLWNTQWPHVNITKKSDNNLTVVKDDFRFCMKTKLTV